MTPTFVPRELQSDDYLERERFIYTTLGFRDSVSVRAAYGFGYWPPREQCGEEDTYRKAPCRRAPGHTGYHSAVGCSAGC